MTSPNNRDWQRRLEEIEQEINQSSSDSSDSSVNQTEPMKSANSIELPPQIQAWLDQIKQWFNVLPPVGKLAVAGVGAFAALTLLSTVLKIVSSLVSIAVMSVVLYLAYRFFIASSSKDS
jgi:hypothetical protein